MAKTHPMEAVAPLSISGPDGFENPSMRSKSLLSAGDVSQD